ncbi:MAG TPA: alkaline phosphatase family protein [Pontiella sp.]|nr:alkaline phosphatase family protein [Pontiella sp.]
MKPKKDKLSLFIFIDAFGWEIKQRHPEFLKGLVQDSKPLETILGYSSACDPSIISGLRPCEHGLWNSFCYDPANSPFKWTRKLRFLPDAIFQRGRVRNQMSKWIKSACGFTGYFQLYAVPFKHLPLFSYAEHRSIWEPGGLPCGTSIFDRLAAKGISYYVHDSNAADEVRLEQLLNDIQDRRIDFAYCSLGRLDALMHAEGNSAPEAGKLLEWYDAEIHTLLDAASENYNEVSWYVFSDHGMHNVAESYNLMADIEALELEWNTDYVAFYDSTMARFWFLNDVARDTIVRRLSSHSKGRILAETELRTFGIYFENRQYGDLVFLMNSGIQIVPSFMGIKKDKGMHGYHPADPDSFASLCSNRPVPEDVTGIQHIHRLMLAGLGLD